MATAICLLKRPRKRRTQINLTIDPNTLTRVRQLMVELGETSLSSFTEGLYECILRDSCEDCPTFEALPPEERERIVGKIGVGHQILAEEGG